MKPLHLLLGAIIFCLALLAASAATLYSYLTTPESFSAPSTVFEVKAGSSFSELARELNRRGIISKPAWWKFYAVVTSQAHKIHVGEYQVKPGITPARLLHQLTSGKVIEYQVTLVEGWTFAQLLRALGAQEKLEHGLTGLDAAEVMAALGRPGQNPEGRFFPDSYRYRAGTSELLILKRAYDRLEWVLADEWEKRAVGLPYETPYEALVMASIVEKETGLARERKKIAGVFVRRLQANMRLQTDPTVIYGLGDRYAGNLTRRHLQQDTPYNTYTRRGLPPTPIATVGRAAIHAALNPEPGTSLYFVAKGDGSHFFSDTLEQHSLAVRKYQVDQRNSDYRSSPQ